MDTERFIEEVRRRRPLWDQKHVNYHSRAACHRLWAETAAMFNMPVSRAKSRWKSLRDMYRVELKKLIRTQTGEPGAPPSNWRHFDSMAFIRDQLHFRPGQTGEGADSPWIGNNFLDDDSSKAAPSPEDLLPHAEFCQLEYPAAVKRESLLHEDQEEENEERAVVLQQRRLQLEEERLQMLREERAARDDGDYLFLMSLLPSIRSLPPPRRMALRSRLHDLVAREVYGDDAH